MTEQQLQNMCTVWFWNNFHEYRRMLHHNNNNSHNSIKGAMNKAIGVVDGVSDLELILDGGRVLFIELKIPGGYQSAEQKDFENKVTERGHRYIIIFSFEEFKNLIIDEICKPLITGK